MKANLIEAGIMIPDRGGSGGGVASLVDVHIANPVSYLTPPAPSNLTVTRASSVIILQWDNPFKAYNNHAYAEIWAAEKANFKKAVIVGQSSGIIFGHSLGDQTTRYFWVRFISTSGTPGPFSSINGAAGVSVIDQQDVSDAIVSNECQCGKPRRRDDA